MSEIAQTFFGVSYYVSQDRGGEKRYPLLRLAHAESGQGAVGTFAMQWRERAATSIREGTRTRADAPKPTPVVDIFEALRKRLGAARKPPQSEVSGRAPQKKDKRRAK